MKIRWSDAARGDVRRLRQYIAQDSPFYAKRFCEQLIGAVDKLADFPQIGRHVPEADEAFDDIRELIFRSYRIIYWNQPDRRVVQILAVIHGAMDLAAMERKPWATE